MDVWCTTAIDLLLLWLAVMMWCLGCVKAWVGGMPQPCKWCLSPVPVDCTCCSLVALEPPVYQDPQLVSTTGENLGITCLHCQAVEGNDDQVLHQWSQ
jgi:hypothetical protein